MSAVLAFLGGIIGIIIIIAMMAIGIYNNLVKLRNYFKNAYAQIDVQLKRRYDLIPNLVETAKGFMKHETDTFTKVVEARNKAHQISLDVSKNPDDPELMKKLKQAESQLSGSLKNMFALSEAYPELKSDKTMTRLMEELTSTENKISFARQAYNDAVTQYNTAREQFPNSILAGMFNFKEAELFEIEDVAEKENIKVKF